jgi:hypothetical protein
LKSSRRSSTLRRVFRSGPPFLLLSALAALLLGAGCDRPVAAPAPADRTAAYLDDGRPLAGLPRLKLLLGAHELTAELALRPEHIMKGMMWRTNVAEDGGMLFAFAQPIRASFYMRNVPMNIDAAYLDPDGVILEIHRLEQLNTNPVPSRTARVQFVLETAEGWFRRRGLGTGVVVRTELGTLAETFQLKR